LRRYLFPLVLGAFGVAVLVGLGVWQLSRMEEKRAYLAMIEARIANPPVALPDAPDPVADKFKAVFAEGRLTGEALEVLAGQTGASPGVRVIEAFALPSGRRILVDRGFLAEADRATPRPPKAARIDGNLHWPLDSDAFTPPPDVKTGLWFARDVPAMAKALGTDPVLIVARAPTGDGIVPMPVDTAQIPNNHWAYAIQWFLMAAVWAGMTVTLLWRIRRRID
jgi:surfeit locus 1 family protein